MERPGLGVEWVECEYGDVGGGEKDGDGGGDGEEGRGGREPRAKGPEIEGLAAPFVAETAFVGLPGVFRVRLISRFNPPPSVSAFFGVPSARFR